MINLDLKGKKAVVCGSTQGIGLAAAIELAELGATICLVARNEKSLTNALTKLDRSEGQQHCYLVADFDNPELLNDVITDHLKTHTNYHILINNSGGPPGGLIQDAKIDEFAIAFKRHLQSNHIMSQALIPGMKEEGYGRIINIISTSVKQPLNGLGVSNTIRGAVANWAKTLANEVGSYGITVNNVLPGATNTVRLSSIIASKSKKSGNSIEEVTSSMQSIIPAKRFAEPSETGGVIAFLASPAASYINGINLPVDGGRTKSL